jgi:hypothetical protein
MSNFLLIIGLIVIIPCLIYFIIKWEVLNLNKAILRSLLLFILSVFLFSAVYTIVYRKNNNSFSYADYLKDQKIQELKVGKTELKLKIDELNQEIDIYTKINESLTEESKIIKPQFSGTMVLSIEFNFRDNNLEVRMENGLSPIKSSTRLGQRFYFKLKNNDRIFDERIFSRPLPDSIYKYESIDNSLYMKLLDGFLLPISIKEYKTIFNEYIEGLKKELHTYENDYQEAIVPYEGFKFGDFLYYSIMNQTTIGATDIYPNSNFVRVLISLQALVSIFITVFLINNIVSKEK